MPVDDEINLDTPEGIAQEDIDRMNAQADELERIADKSEANVEIIRKNMKVFEGKNFKEIDAVTQNAREASGKEISGDAEQRLNEMEERQKEILFLLNEAKSEREKNKKKLTDLEKKQLEDMKQFKSNSGDISNIWATGQSMKNPVGMGMQKIKGLAMRAGVYGAIAVFALEMVEKIVDEIMSTIKEQFQAGGVFDTRKVIENQVKEYQSLNYLTSIKNGNVIFTGDAGQDMVQGAVRGAFNTRDLRDGHLRHIQIYAGE